MVDVVVVADLAAIHRVVLALQQLDTCLGPLAYLGVDFGLVVVVVRQAASLVGFLHRHFAMLLGGHVPRVGLHDIAHAGERPVLGLETLVDHVLQVHALAPVEHAPHLAGSIAVAAIVVQGIADVARGAHHLGERRDSTQVVVELLVTLLDACQVQVTVDIVGSIGILVHVEVIVATRRAERGNHRRQQDIYIFSHIFFYYLKL